jgi:thioredoxin-like negative regulator of GroEL
MLEKARGLDPGSEEVAFHLALVYRDLGQRDEALQLLQELAARGGATLEWQGRIDDAMSSLR